MEYIEPERSSRIRGIQTLGEKITAVVIKEMSDMFDLQMPKGGTSLEVRGGGVVCEWQKLSYFPIVM